MTVEIPVTFQTFVASAVASGQFHSEEQVVEEALRLLSDRDRQREEFRRQIKIGTEQLHRGEYTDFDDESLDQFFEQIKAGGSAGEIENVS
jgi:antitoxin ParD1/3/4